jgi:hypothetical protein
MDVMYAGIVVLLICSICSLHCGFSAASMEANIPPNDATDIGALNTSDAPDDPIETTSHDCQSFNSTGDAAKKCDIENSRTCKPQLALPAPDATSLDETSPTQLTLGQRVSLEQELGPLVVNADGTVGRIANWHQMTEKEKANVLRVLGKRNKERIMALKEQKEPSSAQETFP